MSVALSSLVLITRDVDVCTQQLENQMRKECESNEACRENPKLLKRSLDDKEESPSKRLKTSGGAFIPTRSSNLRCINWDQLRGNCTVAKPSELLLTLKWPFLSQYCPTSPISMVSSYSPDSSPTSSDTQYSNDDVSTPSDGISSPPDTALLQKLSVSKSPVLESVIYCALNKWGIELVSQPKEEVIKFQVLDFEQFSQYAALVNSKTRPTNDLSSRVKALRRWFDGIPKVKSRKGPFLMTVKGSPEKQKKVREMIEKLKVIQQGRTRPCKNDM